MNTPNNAFVLRQSPSGISQLNAISLPMDVIVTGWHTAVGLIQEKNHGKFRNIIHKHCYPKEINFYKAGAAAGTMWRFINGMQIGDWVIVPDRGGVFYVAEITGGAYYDNSTAAIKSDSCYRRPVQWLNGKKAISRGFARAKLTARMKIQGTSAEAGDLLGDIQAALSSALNIPTNTAPNPSPSFGLNLREKLIEVVLKEIHTGHMTPQLLEKLVMKVLKAVGATNVKQIATSKDKGVDIIATFLVGGITQVDVGVQVKCHQGETQNAKLDELVGGLKEENLTQGWLVTTGVFSDTAEEYLESKVEGSGLQISLVDGEQFAGMIIDYGLRSIV